MSNQVCEKNNDGDNHLNTEILKENSLNQTKNEDNNKILESTENAQGNSNDKENIQNIENTDNTITNQTNEQTQQTQSTKSKNVRNRHNTTEEEKEILLKALPEYLKLPNRTTDRQNKERNVAKKLKALSPECNNYWSYKKVRDWFNNNNPDKRTKIEAENQLKKAIYPGSAPVRFFSNASSGNQSFSKRNTNIPDLNSGIFAPYLPNDQTRSQFVSIVNPDPDIPTSSTLSSLNSYTKVLANAKDVQTGSLSDTFIPCYTNQSSVQQVPKRMIQIIPYDVAHNEENHHSSVQQIPKRMHSIKPYEAVPSVSANTQVQQLQKPLPQPQFQSSQQMQPQPHQQNQIIQPQIQQPIQQQQNQLFQIQQTPIQPQIKQIQPQPISQPILQENQQPPTQPQIQPQNQQPQPTNQSQIQQQIKLQPQPIFQQAHQPLTQPQIQQQVIQQPQINQPPLTQQIQPPQLQQIQTQPIQPPQLQQIQTQPIQPPQLQQMQNQPIQPPQIQQIQTQPIQPPQLQQIQNQPIHSPQIQVQPVQPPQFRSQIQQPQLQSIQPAQLNSHQLPPKIQQLNIQKVQPPPPLPFPSTLQQMQSQYQPPPIQTQIRNHPPIISQINPPSYQQTANQDQEENISQTGERICAELPKNMTIIKNSPKKKSPFKKAYEKDIERYETLRRRLDENPSPPSAQMIDFHPTLYEKYQQEQQQRQFSQKQQQNRQESYSVPGSFIEFKKNPESTLFLNNSSFKSKIKAKSTTDDSNEIDQLPLVPVDELKSYIEKLRTITLNRISQLLKIIEERKILIHKQILNINYENKRKSKKKNKDEENLEYSSSETESNNKDDDIDENNEKEKESDSTEKPFIFNHDSQIDFEKKTEERMNELIDFYQSKFENQPIVLTFSIGLTKKSVPPKLLTERSLVESGEFSSGNKNKSGENIDEIINERKCIVNFGRNTNFQTKIHVPKDAQRGNDERTVKFYRGDFEKKETISLGIYDSAMQVESSIFFNNSEEIFLISYDVQDQASLFVFNDSFVQTPFKRSNRAKALCQFPSSLGLNKFVLATDGEQLVYFDVDSMNAEFIYRISNQKEKRNFSNIPQNPESCNSTGGFNINMGGFEQNSSYQPQLNINPNNYGNKGDVAICATSNGDVLVGRENCIYFFNRKKNESTYFDLIMLENMRNISSICAFEINSESKGSNQRFSIPLIIVGASDYPTIYVFNGNDHSLVARLVGHTSGISCLYSKGTVLFSGSIDGSIIMWEFKLIPDDQNQDQKEDNQNENETVKENYTIFAYCSLTLLIHTSPIVSMRQGKVGNIQFLISCDSNLIRSTDINRHNSSFSISVPEEFNINSLNFDGNSGGVDFVLSSHKIDKYTDRMCIFSIDK